MALTTFRRRFPGFLLIGVAALGCSGPPAAHVSGRVTLNQAPLSTGTVVFHPVDGGRPAYGSIDANGRYQLAAAGNAPIEPGVYRVTVIAHGPSPPTPHGEMPLPGAWLTPRRYANVEESNLKFTVGGGDQKIDLALVSEAGSAPSSAKR